MVPRDEVNLRCRKESLVEKITDLRKERDDWEATEPGKELERVKGRRTMLRKALKDCLALNNIVRVNEVAVRSSVSDLLNDFDAFIEEDVLVDVPADEEGANNDGDDNDADGMGSCRDCKGGGTGKD